MHLIKRPLANACVTGLALLTLAFATATSAQTPSDSTSAQLAAASDSPKTANPETVTPTPTPTPAPAQQNISNRAKDNDRNGPRRESLTAINLVKHVNGLFGGFDQGAGVGFGVEFTTADSIPGVELRTRLLTSTRFYRRLELSAYFPKIGSENTHAEVWFMYQRRTRDHFFGIGSRTLRDLETNYQLEQRNYNASLYHDFGRKVQVGGYVRAFNASTYTGKNEDEPPIETLFSGSPTVTPLNRYVPGLFFNARTNNVKAVGGGGFVAVDVRNNDRGLTKGGFAYARVGTYNSFDLDPLALTDYGWTEAELDGRAYIPVFSNKTSLALRGYADLRDPKDGKQVPFYETPWLGGRSHLRGYQNFRFRANNLLLFNTEIRQTVWTQKEDRGVDVFAFIDSGKIWGDTRSATNPAVVRNDRFGDQPWRVGPGGGFQYRYNRSVAVRLDLSKTNERTMVYFSISRGF